MHTRHRKILNQLLDRGAVSFETADGVYGSDIKVTIGLVRKGLVNLRLSDQGMELFWIRGPNETATGALVRAGFLIYLNKDIRQPDGKFVNFFLGRSQNYDLTNKMYRRLLSGWLKQLGLTVNNVLQSIPADLIDYDNRMFSNKGRIVMSDPDDPS